MLFSLSKRVRVVICIYNILLIKCVPFGKYMFLCKYRENTVFALLTFFAYFQCSLQGSFSLLFFCRNIGCIFLFSQFVLVLLSFSFFCISGSQNSVLPRIFIYAAITINASLPQIMLFCTNAGRYATSPLS